MNIEKMSDLSLNQDAHPLAAADGVCARHGGLGSLILQTTQEGRYQIDTETEAQKNKVTPLCWDVKPERFD